MGIRHWTIWGLALAGGMLSMVHAQYYEDTMEPAEIGILDIGELRVPAAVYVGNDVCRLCHEATYQHWVGTRHSRAFVPLRSMMAMAMGKEQGVTACCPAKSGKCLSCHATAHDVPAAYRGPGFRMGEGVACERCHGPGGNHVQAMEDPQSGVDGRLPALGKESCTACHYPKKSHEKQQTPPFNFDRAWKKVAHSMAWERPEDQLEPGELGIWHVQVSAPAAQYTGSASCAQCHAAAYEQWQQSAHARASRGLRSEMGVMMGMQEDMNVIGGPVKNGNCLGCHATAHETPAATRAAGFRMREEGVGCEKCHGPGGEHLQAMRDRQPMAALGLKQQPDEASCMACHRRKRSHDGLRRPPFAYPEAWAQIAH